LECISKENEFLKNENISLSSKLNDICEGNKSLKNKITLVEKEKEIALNENNSLKRKIVLKEKENMSKKKEIVDSHSCDALHATIDKNEIRVLKNRINYLSLTLSNYAFNHSRLKSLLQKKQALYVHAHNPQHTYHTMHVMITFILICMLECTNMHIVAVNAIFQDFTLID